MGVVLGNLRLPSIAEMRRFKEYLVILLVSNVFILVNADLDPTIMLHLDWHTGLLLMAVLLLVRPLGVFAATAEAHYDMLLENWYRGWSFHKTQTQ
jgi:NhaP-type Na+/H+ or K+/H+ antiporter